MGKNFKKILGILCFAIIIIGICTVSVSAVNYSGKCGESVTWSLSDGTLTISGTGEMWDYDFDYGDYTPWLDHRDNINSVVIESGVTSIGDYAFNLCANIENIDIPLSVTTIGKSSFANCTSLTSITIPDSVTSIGDSRLVVAEALRASRFRRVLRSFVNMHSMDAQNSLL